jgi:hypothetical protein
MPLMNAPGEGLPPGCTCLLMAPGTTYEARALNPACPVHSPGNHRLGRVTKFRAMARKRDGY